MARDIGGDISEWIWMDSKYILSYMYKYMLPCLYQASWLSAMGAIKQAL